MWLGGSVGFALCAHILLCTQWGTVSNLMTSQQRFVGRPPRNETLRDVLARLVISPPSRNLSNHMDRQARTGNTVLVEK
jgi:hypothetical protein